MKEAARRRLVERHCAATIRAVATRPLVEYRKNRLFERGRAVNFSVPHLVVDAVEDSVDRNRGVADAYAARLRYSDQALHQSLQPQSAIARITFDILEQLRCETRAAARWAGLRANLDTAFNHWCRHARATGLVENEIGLLIYGVTQIARSHLSSQLQDEEVEGLIESVRFRLAPVIGDDIACLRAQLGDQAGFAVHALNIAQAVEVIARSLSGELADSHISALRERNLLPPMEDSDDKYVESEEGDMQARHGMVDAAGYHVFTTEFDREVAGADLYRLEQRHELRIKLDRLIAAQAVSIPRLAQRLKLLFAQPRNSGWHEGEEEGVIDGRRLSQIVSNVHYRRIFKQEQRIPECDTVVTFLVDNSGSMKRQRYEEVTVLVDVFVRALELAGVKSEVLGFTTGGWAGGNAIKAWRKEGCPENPGRLNDRLHIVYKSADTSWRRSRHDLASMLNPLHYREGLDGEALEWAAKRLFARSEQGRFLVMISDGAPMETATSNYNDAGFLDNHLRSVAMQLHRMPNLHLGALGIALDMDEFVPRSINVDLTATLGNRTFRCLEELFLPVCAVDPRLFA